MKKRIAVTVVAMLVMLSGCGTKKGDEEKVKGGISDLMTGSRNVEIVSWEKNGFVGKEADSGDTVFVNLVTDNGHITQPNGSVYPECRYGIEPGDTESREYKKSRLNDNWYLSAYGEWEDKQFDVGDTVFVSIGGGTEYVGEDGVKTIVCFGLSPELKNNE